MRPSDQEFVAGERMTIREAAALHQELGARLSVTDVRVQARAVEELDGAGLQLLVSLALELGRRGRQLHLDGPSPAFRSLLRLSGTTSQFQIVPETVA